MKFRGWLSWQLWVLSTLVFFAGGAVGIVVAGWLYLGNLATLAADINRKTSRIQLLEFLALQHLPSSGVLALDSAVPPGAEAASAGATTYVSPTPRPTGTVAQVPTKSPAPPPLATAAQKPKLAAAPIPAKPASIAGASEVRTPTAVVTTEPVAVVMEPGMRPVTGEELIQALRFKIEGVNAGKAGVAKLDKNGVHLKNGTLVRPGELFPSGERLLSVDYENERVVTSKRQMLLFFGAN